MTHMDIVAYREVMDKIFRTYGIGAEQLANICQSVSTALLNASVDHSRTPKSRFYAWKSAESEMRDFIGYITAIRQDVLTQEAAAQLTGELFQTQEATQ